MFQFLFRLLFPLPWPPPLLLPSADCTDSIRTKGRCSLEWSRNSSVSPHSHSWCLLVCMINFINFPDLLCHWNKYDSCCAASILPLAKWDAEMCFLVDCRLGQISSKQTKQDSSWSYRQSRCGINTHALVDINQRKLISHLLDFLGTHSRKQHHVLHFQVYFAHQF